LFCPAGLLRKALFDRLTAFVEVFTQTFVSLISIRCLFFISHVLVSSGWKPPMWLISAIPIDATLEKKSTISSVSSSQSPRYLGNGETLVLTLLQN
jgi:hypothetical protein